MFTKIFSVVALLLRLVYWDILEYCIFRQLNPATTMLHNTLGEKLYFINTDISQIKSSHRPIQQPCNLFETIVDSIELLLQRIPLRCLTGFRTRLCFWYQQKLVLHFLIYRLYKKKK